MHQMRRPLYAAFCLYAFQLFLVWHFQTVTASVAARGDVLKSVQRRLLVDFNGVVQGVEQSLARLQLGLGVSRHVDLLELLGHGARGRHQLFSGGHHGVQEASLFGALWVEHFTVDDRALEHGLGQTIAGQLDAHVVHGHANLNFIEANVEGAVNADAVVGRQQDESTFGHSMTGAGHDHGEGVRQHATGQRAALGDQVEGVLWALHHFLEVIATRQDAGLAGDDDDSLVLFGLVKGLVEGIDDVGRHGVDFAVGQRQGGDAIFELVGNEFAHV